jgi:hypothetical protein
MVEGLKYVFIVIIMDILSFQISYCHQRLSHELAELHSIELG